MSDPPKAPTPVGSMTEEERIAELRKEVALGQQELDEHDADIETHVCPSCERVFTAGEMATFNMCPGCGYPGPMVEIK